MLSKEQVIECYMFLDKKTLANILYDTITKYTTINEFITDCNYCRTFDFNSQICKQNGCKDMEDFIFFKEKE